jgi:hypothetical protein
MYRHKIAFVFILCLALTGQAYAQRYLPGQKGLQFTMSAVDGFNLEKGDKQAFAGGITLSTYKKNCRFSAMTGYSAYVGFFSPFDVLI